MTSSRIWRAASMLLAIAVTGGVNRATVSDADRWIRVDYSALIDGRRLTHSGEPVGVVLARLGGRSLPKDAEHREDALAYRLLDPILEPYAFVLPDALDSLASPHDPPMVEVGSLWEPGEAQPAWVELVRARRFLLESDGEGHLRACLPAASLESLAGDASPGRVEDPVQLAKTAWNEAWPVLRHALAGERRRLATRLGGAPPALDVEVHAYRHVLSRSAFDLGVTPWRTTISDTGPSGLRPPLDLVSLKSILDRGLRIEGARLEPSSRLKWFTSETEVKPTILGRALTLSDVAVAYRAVARGGNGEPYMSLDRAPAPHVASVNYGGRLRDTALGMVSLLSDVRFKTFSVGIDLLGDGDVRETTRRALPEFMTHLERFAVNPSASAVLNQQTRFWFYPDDVDLVLSAEGDVLAFRKVRMTAASERVKDAGAPTSDPPWTTETVSFLNAQYDGLAKLFPELSDLDESVRLLSLFTWLETARDRGLPVPDLDVLLAVDLPALATPRRFPELLSHDVIPPAGAKGIVDVLDRTDVGDALDRLQPEGSQPLPAPERFARDQAMLNPQVPDQAALAAEMAALPADARATDQDLLSYRAERLLMHARVLLTIPADRRAMVESRRKAEPATRVFSVGIGGVDLGMNAVLARAMGRAGRLGLSKPKRATPVAPQQDSPAKEVTAPLADPLELPATEWPDHGLGRTSESTVTEIPDGKGTIQSRRRPGAMVRRGSFKPGTGRSVAWEEVLSGMEGPEVRARRRIADPSGGSAVFQRVEDERFLSYRFSRDGNLLHATLGATTLPDQAFGVAPPKTATEPVPADLMLMDLARTEPSAIRVRLRGADGRERAASVPRALLQRLVRGREIDLTPERPLPGWTPAAEVLGSAHVLMVLASPQETREPWSGSIVPLPGEEDATRIAPSLTRWWSAEAASSARAVVGVDPAASPARWARAPRLDGKIAVLAPADAFPANSPALRAGLDGLAGEAGAKIVVLVSAEPPGVLGRRLRSLATDPELEGKTLAVAALGGSLRADVPASLLAEGRLAAVGVFEAGPVGLSRSIAEVAQWIRVASAEGSKGRRVEDPAGPFVWFY